MTRPSQATKRWFFILLSSLILYIFWQMLNPFVLALVTAGIFAIVLTPADIFIRKHVRWNIASPLILTLGVFLIVFLPLSILMVMIAQQATEIVTVSLQDTTWLQTFSITDNSVFKALPAILQEEVSSLNIASVGKNIAEWTASNLGDIASKSMQFAFNTFIFFLALFNFLLYRSKIHVFLLELSPFKDSVDEKVINRIIQTIRSVVFGALIIAIVQAILASIGLTIFGVPGALLWGSLVLVAAQIPTIGVGLIMIPSIGYLLATGHTVSAVGLTFWSVVVVGLVDNLLSPMIIGAKTKMPEFLILLSVLGGLQVFGPIGFILGPTVLALLMVLVEMYRKGILESK